MIDVTDDGDVLVVAACGELDLTTSPRLVEAFASTNGHKELVCDLTAVSFIDSTGIHALLALQRSEPDRFVLSGTSACVERLLEMTGTANVFRRAPTA
jgi:anti-anti-sigma factor